MRSQKREALNYFMKLILEKARDKIGKIIVFGSLARGKADKDSDIDVLVIGIKDIGALLDVCADAQLDTWYEHFESVEPLVEPLENLERPDPYFLQGILQYGKEVYSMEEEEIRKTRAKGHLDLAEIFLEDSRKLLHLGSYRSAIDLAYNASEHCAKGLLNLKGEELPSTHGGIVGEFGRLYVKPGEVEKELGRRFGRALERRNEARYKLNVEINREKAEEVISLADSLIALLSEGVK